MTESGCGVGGGEDGGGGGGGDGNESGVGGEEGVGGDDGTEGITQPVAVNMRQISMEITVGMPLV